MDYQQSRAYVKDADQYAGGALDLTNIKELMNRLGNPQDRLKYVHVAGTNGKGSVIAYLYTTLSDAGYRVGRYISPSVYSYREKMEVDGRAVSREAFAGYITRVAAAIEEMTEEGLAHPTPFEIETAVAFLFFAEEKCDLVILEVGMGGDLDATNIIKNTVLAVLVPISMDHQAFLGNTLSEIAEISAALRERDCRLELEAFVHGAMCISYSGRCLLSNYFTGRDANRGACTHPCRWKYAIVEETRPGEYMPVYENERGTYIFNSKDLCMIDHLPDLIQHG